MEKEMAVSFLGYKIDAICDDEADIDMGWQTGSHIYVINSNKHYLMCSGSALMTINSTYIRTVSALTGVSIVTSTSAGGTQVHATKDSSVRASVQDSITTAVGGTSTSTIFAEICATNSTTAGDWTEAGRIGDSQSITLAIALQSVQPGYRQINFDVPGGWYFRLRSTGAGTHSESFISGQKTIYG